MASLKFNEELYIALIEGVRMAEGTPLFDGTFSSQYRTLWLLSNAGGSMLPGELAKGLHVTTPRVTVILNELDKEGLIERKVSADDRRKIDVSLTKKGKNELKKHIDNASGWLSGVINRVGDADSEAVLRFFNEMIAYAEQS